MLIVKRLVKELKKTNFEYWKKIEWASRRTGARGYQIRYFLIPILYPIYKKDNLSKHIN